MKVDEFTPETIVRSMAGLGIIDTGTLCNVECSTVSWHEREENRELYYTVSDKRECGGRIFFSKNENKNLPCGNCAIRGSDCVEAVIRLLWKEKGTDERGISLLRNEVNNLIVYSGFEAAFDFIYTKAQKKFEYRWNELLDEKTKREQAEADRKVKR
jgi:hypothetical protein